MADPASPAGALWLPNGPPPAAHTELAALPLPPFADAGSGAVYRALRSRNVALELELQRLAERVGAAAGGASSPPDARALAQALDAERTRRGGAELRAEAAEAEAAALWGRCAAAEAAAASTLRLKADVDRCVPLLPPSGRKRVVACIPNDRRSADARAFEAGGGARHAGATVVGGERRGGGRRAESRYVPGGGGGSAHPPRRHRGGGRGGAQEAVGHHPRGRPGRACARGGLNTRHFACDENMHKFTTARLPPPAAIVR